MQDMINTIIAFLLPMNDLFLYLFLFASAVIENLFPPIPGDTITAFGAFLVGTGRLDYLLVYAVTTLGSVCGFVCLVLIGRLLGREYFIGKDYRHLPAKRIVLAESWFRRYGYFVVLANRFLPGVRSVISLASGIARLSLPKVFALAIVSASIWNLIWIHTGYLLGDNWELVKDRMSTILRNYNTAVLALMAVGASVARAPRGGKIAAVSLTLRRLDVRQPLDGEDDVLEHGGLPLEWPRHRARELLADRVPVRDEGVDHAGRDLAEVEPRGVAV